MKLYIRQFVNICLNEAFNIAALYLFIWIWTNRYCNVLKENSSARTVAIRCNVQCGTVSNSIEASLA